MNTNTASREGSAESADYASCFETREIAKKKLEAVELELAMRMEESPITIRKVLILGTRRGEIIEDELVSRWHELYSNYREWATDWGDTPPHDSRTNASVEAQKAANAAFVF